MGVGIGDAVGGPGGPSGGAAVGGAAADLPLRAVDTRRSVTLGSGATTEAVDPGRESHVCQRNLAAAAP